MSKNQKNYQNVLEMTPNLEQNEQGRSMVEMLGVLAVIGVLSVGAISGYRYAMNKYRANQTVNELNLLSHQVGIAMMSKNGVTGTLKLGEPYDTNKKLTSSGYDIAFGCGESGDETPCQNQNKFYFEVKNVSEGVCKELVQMSEHMQFIKTRPEICATGTTDLNFVFELPDAIGGNTGSSGTTDRSPCNDHGNYDETAGTCTCDTGYSGSNCYMDQTCSGHGVLTNFSTSDMSDMVDTEANYYCSCTDGWSGVNCEVKNDCNGNGSRYYNVCSCYNGWTGLNCETGANDKTCGGTEKKACTGSNEYCKANSNTCYSDGEDTAGTCHNANDEKKTVTVKGKTYIVSTGSMDWWSAKRFCAALDGNKHLVSLSELGCSEDSNSCEEGVYSGFMKYDVQGGWTSDLEGDGSYSAYSVNFSNSRIYLSNRCDNGRAICQ